VLPNVAAAATDAGGERHHDETHARGRVPEPDVLLGNQQASSASASPAAEPAAATPEPNRARQGVRCEPEHLQVTASVGAVL